MEAKQEFFEMMRLDWHSKDKIINEKIWIETKKVKAIRLDTLTDYIIAYKDEEKPVEKTKGFLWWKEKFTVTEIEKVPVYGNVIITNVYFDDGNGSSEAIFLDTPEGRKEAKRYSNYLRKVFNLV